MNLPGRPHLDDHIEEPFPKRGGALFSEVVFVVDDLRNGFLLI